MKLTEYERQTMSNATVQVILDARLMALRNGANPLKLWDQLQARMRAAVRTTTNAAEWATKFLRDLQIAAPSKDLSRSMAELDRLTTGKADGWLALVEREHGFLIASARIEAERRADLKKEMKDIEAGLVPVGE